MNYFQAMITKLLLVPKHFFLCSALLWTGFIAFLCLIKSSEVPVVKIQNIDKIVHSFLHFVFTLLWFLFFKKQIISYSNSKLLLFSFFLSALYGISIEVSQELFTVSRSADFFDILANSIGSLIAIAVIYNWQRKINVF